jgi:hypothetical protein
MMFVLLFAFLFKILGANFEDDDTFDYNKYDDNHGDYRNINQYVIYFISSFRNSIGDLSSPHYKYWWTRI